LPWEDAVLQNVNSRIGRAPHEAETRRYVEEAAAAKTPTGSRNDAERDLRFARTQLVAIVDDDLDAREGLNNFVQSLGHMSATFASAEDYLNSNLNGDTACLILDVNLPGMSGLDLQARLIEDGYCTPIIFWTGRYDEAVRSRVLRAGALAYLTKPGDGKELTDYIRKALAG
jgi:FixJ family two-component response regulator